jgi:type IV pilus assembly protein PilC
MPSFQYKAVDMRGVRKSGTIEGKSIDLARTQLTRMRMKVVSLEEVVGDDDEGQYLINLLGGRIRIDKKGNMRLQMGKVGGVADKELIIFTKQLQTMVASGVPLNQSLEILARQQKNPDFGKVVAKVQKNIEEGAKFSESLAKFPASFDTLFVSMVKAGEESGRISEILSKITVYVEKSSKITRQVKSAMTYPAMILFVASVVSWGLITFVVPKFASQFAGAGRKLPALTQYVMDLSDLLNKYWYAPFVIVGGLIFAFSSITKTEKGRWYLHAFLLKAPVVGDLVRKVVVGRFCSTMASMLTSGVNIIQALTICAASAGNVVVQKFIIYARTQVEQGQLLSKPIKENPIFPQMVSSMMEVGEKSGRMDEMLLKVSDFYEEEVDEAVKAMLAMIEPLLIVGIGIIVGVLVVAMYLPILDMGNNVGD